MTAIPTNRTTANSPSEHVSDHNILHHFNNEHPTDPSAHIGTSVANTPAGNIAATNVQAALNELDAEKLSIAAAAVGYVGLVAAPGGTDDTAVVQAAINAANAAGGGMLQLSAGAYVCTTLTLYRGVHLVGMGIGGDVFSSTDAGFPFRGTVIKLKSGTNADLIRTENFAALTGVTSPSGYDVPERFGLRNLVLDGNNQGNSSGWPLRVYGRAYFIEGIYVQNGASGGVYSEGASGGYDMVAKWSNVHITRCTGAGLEWRGPHDSQFINVSVEAPSGTPSPTYGIRIVSGAQVGGEQFTNCHAWGGYSVATWEIGCSVGQFLNCYADGTGIILLGSGNVWDGLILGTNTPGQYAVKLGDGTTRTIGQNRVRGRVTQFKGSPYAVQTLNTTTTGNRFEAIASMGGVRNWTAKGNVYTTTGAVAAGAATIPLSGTADLPAAGTLYADDGTNRTSALAYTGKTTNSLTGVSGVPAGGLNSGAALWLGSSLSGDSDFGWDSFEVYDYDVTTASGLILRRPTPNGQSTHLARDIWSQQIFSQEGVVLAGAAGAPGGRILGGSGAPVFSATAGDLYVRTDTPTVAGQRLYINNGTTNWVDATSDAALAHLAGTETFTGAKTFTGGVASTLTGATAASRYVGATTAGAPTSGTFAVGDFVIDQGGTVWICTTAGTPGTWSTTKPVDPLARALGYINWNYNSAAGGSGNVPTSQRIDAVAIWLPAGTAINNINLNVTTAAAGTAPTGFYVGLTSAAKVVAQSSNLNSNAVLTSTGAKSFPLSATYTTSLTDSPSGLYYVLILLNGAFGTTNPAFMRANGSTPGTAPSGPSFGNIGTGQATIPANGTAVTLSAAAGLGWHVGVS